MPKFFVDIEVYNPEENSQAKYLVHGYDDVYWTDDLDEAMSALKQEIIKGNADA